METVKFQGGRDYVRKAFGPITTSLAVDRRFVRAVVSLRQLFFLVVISPPGKRQGIVMIIKKGNGYYVISERLRKNLGGPSGTRLEALKRLRDLEFLHKKKRRLI